MTLQEQLIYLFSALGAINGLALSGYFLFPTKEKKISSYFLGGLILMFSIRVIKSVFLHYNKHLFEAFVQIGLSACILIGPFLFLYVVSKTKKDNNLKRRWSWHIIPFIAILLIFSSQFSYYENYKEWIYFIVFFIYKQWGIYIIISGYYLRQLFKKVWQRKERLSDQDIWLLNIYIGTAIIWFSYQSYVYTSYIVGALSFSFIFYISILLWITKKGNKKKSIDPTTKYSNSILSEADVEEYELKLMELISNEKPFLDPKLTLTKLSEQLGVNSKILSQIINQTTKDNYSNYIAKLRVEEAKLLLSSEKHKDYKIAYIAYESGFNSLSSFNASFKKITGQTANDYRKSV